MFHSKKKIERKSYWFGTTCKWRQIFHLFEYEPYWMYSNVLLTYHNCGTKMYNGFFVCVLNQSINDYGIIYPFYLNYFKYRYLCSHLCSWGVDVLHVLNAAYAVIGHFTAGQTDKVPKTTLTIKPAAGACKRHDVRDHLDLNHLLKYCMSLMFL